MYTYPLIQLAIYIEFPITSILSILIQIIHIKIDYVSGVKPQDSYTYKYTYMELLCQINSTVCKSRLNTANEKYNHRTPHISVYFEEGFSVNES